MILLIAYQRGPGNPELGLVGGTLGGLIQGKLYEAASPSLKIASQCEIRTASHSMSMGFVSCLCPANLEQAKPAKPAYTRHSVMT